MWDRLEGREIRRRLASSARRAARRGITAPEVGDRPRPDLPEGTDLLPQIRHIVILMMENHSYDNYLGMLADRGEGLPLGPDGTPDVVNFIPNGQAFPAHHMTSTTQVKNDPSQNWHATHIQFADGRNDGFAAAVARALPGADPAVPMGYWTEDDLPSSTTRSPEPPKLPEPAQRWGSWGRQPRRHRVRDLKWSSVRRTRRRPRSTGPRSPTPTPRRGHGGSHLTRAVTMARSG